MESSMTTRRPPAAEEKPPEQKAPETAEATPSDIRHVGAPPGAPTASSGPRDLIEKAARSPQAAKALSEDEKIDALAWLLQDDPADEVVVTKLLEVNVGADTPLWTKWVIRQLDVDEMTQLQQLARQEAGMNRAARRAGMEPEIDSTLFQLRQIALATVDPDLRQAAEQKGVASANPLDGPVILLRRRFERKPGLITLLAAEIGRFSGYEEADVRQATPETTLAAAAGNS